ncbi:MAG TPA: 3-deoxy-7-phosphoheptulonate synthase [Flavobacteriales bacterium]|nr:3-deoxy-7-phosphoheptulonate synthase [Flavobacteriales bacterium]HIA11045.1 3-deoxy-7-phosphoheptulonate synthase [Flavobacteriales bacterium]HIO71732.1 3-deoxy-7-phosphoheptulonate synthase [Flavobacteriales bacterium]
MIIHLKGTVSDEDVKRIAKELCAFSFRKNGHSVLVTSSSLKELDEKHGAYVEEHFPFGSDMQLASRNYISETRSVTIGANKIGGTHNNTLVIAGPCSVESEEQITQSAELMIELGISTLRAGCYKPRTSPYSFQGLELEGLKLLDKIRSKYGLNIITEVRDSTHVDEIIEYADIVQIGAKSMYDHGILKRCGKTDKPVLLKRGFGTTLKEFVQMAEFVLSGGNENVILCERGIRTFENDTRFTLDLCGVAYLKEYTNLPIILDPSHAMGYAYGVGDLARACAAMGVDGLLIEVHPNPKVAKSDASQQLDHMQFTDLLESLKVVTQSVGRTVI